MEKCVVDRLSKLGGESLTILASHSVVRFCGVGCEFQSVRKSAACERLN